MSDDAYLQLQNLSLAYPTSDGFKTVVQGLNLQLEQGHIGCLLGASGCGKTTVLRAIAGFEPLRAGTIHLDHQLLSSIDQTVVPEKRHVGMMFQDYALFPHLSVEKNIAFGLRKQDKNSRTI